MSLSLLRSLALATLFSAAGFAASPATAPIGIAMGSGVFDVNTAPVTGPTDLANGTDLRTTITPSDVHLENGVDARLATRSSGTVYGDRLVLHNGAVRMNHFEDYSVQAGGLTIQADSFDTQAIIRTTPKTIEIASIGGTLRVTDSGTMMTRVLAGTKVAFQNTGATSGQNSQTTTGANPGQPAQTTTGAAAPQKGPLSDKKAILWAAGICAVGAAVVGGIAWSQGKSPF